MKIKQLILIMLCLLMVWQMKGQNTCSTASVETYPINNTVSSYTMDVYWFKVTLDAGNFNIKLTNYPGVGKITKADVYIGACGSQTLVSQDSIINTSDTTFNIPIYNTVNATPYYIKLYNRGGSITFNRTMATGLLIGGDIGFCPGQNSTLIALPINPQGTKSYTWQPGGIHTNSIVITPTTNTTYTLTYVDGGGSLTQTVTVFQLPSDICNSCQYVKNGAFESYNNPVPYSGNIFFANDWYNGPSGSADYFSSFYNVSSQYSVPTNKFASNTAAHSGNGYVGFATYSTPFFNYREYAQSILKCSLVSGQNYNFSCWVIAGSKSTDVTDNIGILFSQYFPSTLSSPGPSGNLTNYVPQINSGVISDYTNWTHITGTIAGNGEGILTIGNFYDDTHTQVNSSGSPDDNTQGEAYYLLDDVSIIPATPTLSASSNTVTCLTASTTITLTATGSPSVYTTWTDGINTYSGSVISIPAPSVTTTYTCSVNLPCISCPPLTQTITVVSTGLFSPTLSVNNPTICSGQNTTITASGANTYSWSTGATTSTISVSPGSTTVYTVTGTSAAGCSSVKTATVTVNPTPTLSVNNPTICSGQSATITASGANTYSWSTGATTSSVSVSPGSTTVYTVTGTSAAGCSSVKTATVTVNSLPVISITPSSTTICQGSVVSLVASGASSYIWQPGGAVANPIGVTGVATTVYTVTGTSTVGCTSTQTAIVNVNPTPTLSVNNPTICSGQSATITASGANTYSWSTGASTSSISVSPGSTTVYTVTGTSAAGCKSTKTVTVTVNSLPVISITPSSTTICQGSVVSLVASGASSYIWQPGGAVANPIGVTGVATTVYTVTGTSTVGCTSTQTAIVNVPSISITPSTTLICASGGSSTLTASGGTSYTWSPGGVSNPLVVTPTVTATYTVSSNVSGCTPTAVVTVVVSSSPTVSMTNTTTTICNSSASFTAVPTPTNVTYNWNVWDASMTGTLSVPITGSTTATPTINFNNVYQNVNICATVTNTAGCSATTCTLLTACCQTPTNTTKYTNTTFTTNTSLVGSSTQKYQFSGTITVSSGTLQLVTADVTMDPFTKIIVNSGAMLQISESYLHGCNAMWRGIVAVGSSTVQITASKVDDGIRALVDSTGAATFYVRVNYFNNNYISILGKGSKPTTSSYTINQNIFTASSVPSPTSTPYVPTTPTYTVAPYLYSYPVGNLLYPYQNQKAYAGIQLISANQAGTTNSMIPIGSPNIGEENIFDKLQVGLHVYRSNALVQNNVFQNIKNSVNPGSNIAGIYTVGHSGYLACAPPLVPCQNTSSVVVSSNSTTVNHFDDCDYGIYSSGKLSLYAYNNIFNNQGTAIYMKENSLNINTTGSNNVRITENKITKSVIGIEIYNNTRGSSSITNNRIDNTTTNPNANYQNNFAIRCTEATLSTNPSNFPYYNIYNNYINNYYNGINTALTYSAQISDNDITLLADNTNGHVQVGINFSNTNSCYVLNNQVTISGSSSINNSWQIGLATANSTVEKIRCNQIKNICFGLYFVGQNYTAPGDGIIANQMDNNAAGIMLLSGGEIGNQYYTVSGTNYSTDNQWLNWAAGAYRTYVNDGNLTSASGVTGQSRMYTRSTPAQYDIPSGSFFPSASIFGANPLLPSYASNTSISCTYSATPLFKTNSAQLINSKLMQMGREIGANAISYNYNSDNFKEVSRRNLLRNIKLQQLDVSQDSILNPFVQNIVNENTGRFFVIDSLLNEKDSLSIIQAQQLNQAIVSVNDADALLQQSNELYIKSLNGKLKPSEIASLEQIARECPSEKGQAVIQARAVAFQYTHKTYKNNCETVKFKGIDNHRVNQAGGLGQDQVYLYPNPTNNLVYVFNESDQAFTVRFYNMIGELVLEKEKVNHEAIDVSSLSTGVYIYKIYSSQQLMVNGKLIISK